MCWRCFFRNIASALVWSLSLSRGRQPVGNSTWRQIPGTAAAARPSVASLPFPLVRVEVGASPAGSPYARWSKLPSVPASTFCLKGGSRRPSWNWKAARVCACACVCACVLSCLSCRSRYSACHHARSRATSVFGTHTPARPRSARSTGPCCST